MPSAEPLPLTPEMPALLRARTNPLPYLLGFLVLATVIVGAGAASGQLEEALGGAIAAGIIFVVALWGFYFRRLNRDLRAGVFLRSTGRLGARISDPPGGESSITYLVICPDGTALDSDEAVVRRVQKLDPPQGSVDYAPHARLIFAILDSHGRSIYRDRRLPR